MLAGIRSAAIRALPDPLYLSLKYFRVHGRFPRLKHPQRFTEKIQASKLRGDKSAMASWADKCAAKAMVADIIGRQYIVPTLYSGAWFPPLADRNWPIPFVVKASHGSNMNVFVRNDKERDWPSIEHRLRGFLSVDYGRIWRERHYSLIPRRILIEPFLSASGNVPPDYKIFVFDGQPRFIQVDTGRFMNHRRAFFDLDWNKMPFEFAYRTETAPLARPESLNLMLALACQIAAKVPGKFSRIDFYEIEQRPYFGEVTFQPESGFARIEPADWDLTLGQLWPEF